MNATAGSRDSIIGSELAGVVVTATSEGFCEADSMISCIVAQSVAPIGSVVLVCNNESSTLVFLTCRAGVGMVREGGRFDLECERDSSFAGATSILTSLGRSFHCE